MTRGPRTLAHQLDPAALAGLGVGLAHGGVVIGFRPDGAPVTVQLFRSRPTQVAVVCTGYTARLIAFRAMAVGAMVEIAAARTTSWTSLLDLQPPGSATLVAAGDHPAAATPRRPLLRCEEVPVDALAPSSGLAAWQTRIAVPAAVSAASTAALTAFDLVIVRRLPPDAVYQVQLAFGLPDQVAVELARLQNDSFVALAGGQAMVLTLGLTSVELSILGPPNSAY